MNIHTSNNSLNASGSIRPNYATDSIVELQRILADERDRASKHKQNYQQIKIELSKLQENYNRLEKEYVVGIESRQGEVDECQRKLLDTSHKLIQAQHEITELRVNQITDQRVEAVRLKIEEQFESVYQERFSVCARECDSLRAECVRLRTENMFLTNEYDHQHRENARILEELKTVHDAEINRLKSDRARLLSSCTEVPQESQSTKELTKDNGILRSHLKALSNELQEAVGKLEHQRSHFDQEMRAKSKQLSESSGACRRLEIEIESVRKQLTDCQKEVSTCNSENVALHFKENELQRQSRALENKLGELTQRAKVDLTQLQLETTKQRGEIERQKDLLTAKTEELEYQLQLAGTKCGQLEAQLQEREVAIARREAAIKETEWAKLQQLENDKMELESQVADLQSSLREEKNSVSSKMEALEERVRCAELKERTAEKESDAAKHKSDSLVNEMKNLKVSLNEIKNKFVQREAELDECYNRLALYELTRKEKEDLEQQVKLLDKRVKETDSQNEAVWNDKEKQWLDDRERQRQRIKELEEGMAKSLEKTRLLQEELRRKNKKHSKYFQDQNKRLQISGAKISELQTKNDLLKRNVPSEEYQRLNRELKELRRRHQEYRSIIMRPGGPDSFQSEGPSAEAAFEQSLQQLKRRLEQLDELQQGQLPEMLKMQLAGENEKEDDEKEVARYGPQGDNL